MGHIDLDAVRYELPDGRVLLDDVSFRVGDGTVTTLIGPNGSGKTTLLRLVAGEIEPHGGTISRSGGLGVMPQLLATEAADDLAVQDLLLSVAPPPIGAAGRRLDAAEEAMVEADDERSQLTYAHALSEWGDVGGYEAEVLWDVCCMAALGAPYERVRWRRASSLSGGEQKRLMLEVLLRGPEEVLLLDEPDNHLDVPGKRWLEASLAETSKSVLMVTHDRELLANAAERVVTLELGHGGNTVWVHGGGFAGYHQARRDRNERLEELRRRWDEDRARLAAQMLMYKQKSAYNSDMASRYRAAETRLRKFDEAGPPQATPRQQHVAMRLRGERTGKRAVRCEHLGLTGLMEPFDLEVWFGDRVAVLGSNGSGKSHFLRLLATGGTDPEAGNRPVSNRSVDAVAHTGRARLGARVRPGWFVQSQHHPELVGSTLLEILARDDGDRVGRDRETASRVLARYGLVAQANERFETLSGGQKARLQVLLLELSGATLLLLDEPTDNLDLDSAEALEAGLDQFEGTVLAVTHDRWFARRFDRYVVFGADGRVRETPEPVWDEGRVERSR